MLLPMSTAHPLTALATELRLDLLDTIYHAKTGHIGGSLSCLDILTALYFSPIFNFDRDHFILSAGHLCLAHYVVLSKIGKFSHSLLSGYCDFGSKLQGHESITVPGVNYSSGSLGQGLSFAAGLALADKDRHTVCVTTDGEHNEGQVWEAVMFANKYHLGNLINIVDYNKIQIGGTTQDIMPLGELAAKYIRFGWTVINVNGHSFKELINALKIVKNSTIYPACIIAHTVSGKGISFMENDHHYHDIKNLSSDLYQRSRHELTK